MNLLIDDVLCHHDLEIELNPGANLVTGKNSSGKTSLATALAAVLTHNPNPLGVSATALKRYIRDNCASGAVALTDPASGQTVTWMPGEGVEIDGGEGNADPLSNPQAVGLVDFCRQTTAKERAKMWEDMFLPENPEEILRPGWEMSEARLTGVLETIKDRGWSETVAIYEGQRREAKAKWGNITGAVWGAKKALTWVPADWREELKDESEDSLAAKLQDAQDAVNSTRISQAVDHERESQVKMRIKKLETAIPNTKETAKQAKAEVQELQAKRNEKEAQYKDAVAKGNALNETVRQCNELLQAKPPHQCPHCKKGLLFDVGDVKKWTPPSNKELEDAQTKLGSAANERDKIKETLAILQEEGKALVKRIRALDELARDEEAKLRSLETEFASYAPKEPVAGGISQSAFTALENNVEQARSNLQAWKTKRHAERENENIVELDVMCELLGPSGARAGLMKKSMDTIRHILKGAVQAAGWEEIAIAKDYQVTSNGRPILLCAANEQAKARWLLQICSALISETNWIVIDAADLLRDESWTGLVKLVNSLVKKVPEMTIVVAATSTDCPENWAEHQI